MKEITIDLRSDTVTHPTQEMRKAMYEAEVGDDVLGEDPTTNSLEAEAAELLDKEAALFVPSGTFGNQVALFTHCNRGDEVILSEEAHVLEHESGAPAYISGVQLRSVATEKPYITWAEIEPRLRKEENIHYPTTGLVVLENALSNGEVMPLEEMAEIHTHARDHRIPVHLDGARLFNAASYLGVEASRIVRFADSVMFCLSKGLCAPIGSLLAGTDEFIKRARKRRKIMGGGMRQTGILAAAGLVALRSMTGRLHEDREKAEVLAEAMKGTGVLEVRPEPVKINMFFARFREGELAGMENRFVEILKSYGVLTYPAEGGWLRFVTHYHVSLKELKALGSKMDTILGQVRETAGPG
ncbi:MAG TPA: GntG family PLP-dependent aldolase [Spirochaetia bacterium]|nr:GntG family PLP-dependent aldolase [Spirochaetia bacterium]